VHKGCFHEIGHIARFWLTAPTKNPGIVLFVRTGVQAIARYVAAVAAAVSRRVPDIKRGILIDQPASRLILQPKESQSWWEFIEWLLAIALLQSTAATVVDHHAAGRPTALSPLPWWACQPILAHIALAPHAGGDELPGQTIGRRSGGAGRSTRTARAMAPPRRARATLAPPPSVAPKAAAAASRTDPAGFPADWPRASPSRCFVGR
jgi:hypothetical protein